MKQHLVYLLLLALILTACQVGGAKTKAVNQLPSQMPAHIFTQIPESLDTPFIPTRTPNATPSQYTTPLPSSTSTQVSPPIPTNDRISVSNISILTPQISPASEIIDSANISAFFLQHASPLTIALNDSYIYWVDHSDPRFLYRIPQSGGTPEVVAKSLYEGGRLDCLDLQSSEHWLVLCDTDTPGIPGNWKVRAINLDDLSETVLLSSDENAPILLSSFGISLNGNLVLCAYTTIKDNELDENVVTLANLETDEKHELLRKKADTLVTWMLSLSGSQAVIQQGFTEPQGVKDVLYLLDLTNGKMNDLLTDEGSAWPGFSFPWVIWMQQGNQGYMKSFVVYNLVDDLEARVPGSGSSPDKPTITGSWVYWKDQGTNEAGNAIYIYDIEKNTTYVLESPGPNQFYEAVYIHGNTIAWVRNTEFSQAVSDHYLEWATLK